MASIELSTLQSAQVIIGGLILLSSLLILYPFQLVLIHTLIETPYAQSQSTNGNHGYGLAPSKDDEDDLARARCDDAVPKITAIETMHTRSVLTAFANLKRAGIRGFIRAVPAQIAYILAHEVISFLLGGVNPVVQLMQRIASSDPTGTEFSFSPIAIISMVLVKGVILLPMDLVITRQIIGMPDNTAWWTHLSQIFSSIGLRALVPLLIPQILMAAVPLLLRNLNVFLHFLVLQETAVQPGWYAFFAGLEILWQLTSLIFVIAPLQAVAYRAQTSIISHFPPFSSFISYPASYISPLAELQLIVEEEKDISGTWYGRYIRFFKVLLLVSAMMIGVMCVVLLIWYNAGLF